MFGRKAETPPTTTERASELIERVKDSEAVAKAQAKSGELAELARTKMKDAHLDERALELGERARTIVRESEAAQRAAERARVAGDQTLERVGAWLADSGTAEKMGMQPTRRRRFSAWLALVVGAGVGFVVAKLTERQEAVEPFDDFAASAERMATTPPPPSRAPVEPTDTNGGLDLANRIRSSLDADPRTAELGGLAINVAETTVFVRGSVPQGTDEASIREVVAGVPGVTDVDLQVTASA
ncbi:MAG: hypothetical protein GEU81_12450 [Nitriliruptorales bacterium]|nr:hypothetical protein [Nitriliruptorales bacterium]